MLRKNRIAVVIPAYNEAQSIRKVVNNIRRHRSFAANFLIVVVNDGSTDKTREVIPKSKQVIVMNHIVNLGAGAATRTGFKVAQKLGCSHAIMMDADGQHSFDDALQLLKFAQKSKTDLVIGSRLGDTRNMPLVKLLGNKLLNLVSYLLLGVRVSDSQSGLRVCSRKALDTLTYFSDDYAYCSEMIWRAQNLQLSIAERPVGAIYTDYSKAKGQKNVSGFMAIFASLAKHRVWGLVNE